MRVLVLTTLLVIVAVTASAATVPPATVMPATQATLKALSTLTGTSFDVAFMRALVPVHEEAVEIAMAATLNADHTQVLKWNQAVVERKNAEVRQMLGWLKVMGASPARRNAGVQTSAVKQMRVLKDAALEKAYLPLMATHLEQSAAMAQLAASKASDPSLRSFAAGVAKKEKTEAAMLRSWLKGWYGK
jgi:uncharacterized protein (DUF305 family)